MLASAAVVAGLSAAIGAYAPVLDTPVARAAVLMLVLGGLAWVNMRGVKQGTRVLEVFTIAKLAPLLLLVGAGIFVGGGAMWQIGPLPDLGTIGRATLVLIFAFSGAESTMSLSGEVTNPSRTVPRALVFALALITGLYVTVHLAAAVALGASLPLTTDAPLAEAAGVLIGPQGRAVLLAGTVISMFGYVSALIMSTPRLVFAVAQRGLLPEWLGRVHPRWHTPAAAIATQTLLVFLVASSGTFGALASFASVAVVSVTCWPASRPCNSSGAIRGWTTPRTTHRSRSASRQSCRSPARRSAWRCWRSPRCASSPWSPPCWPLPPRGMSYVLDGRVGHPSLPSRGVFGEDAGDDLHDVIGREGFLDHGRRPHRACHFQKFAVQRARHRHDRDVGTLGAHLPDRLQALAIGHHQVGQQQVHAAAFAQAHGLQPVAGLEHLVPGARQRRRQQQA